MRYIRDVHANLVCASGYMLNRECIVKVLRINRIDCENSFITDIKATFDI